MNIETKIFNKAFSVFQEFGPQRSIPREERIKAKFPELQDDEISQLIEKYKEIESFSYGIAEQVRDEIINQDKGISSIADKYPVLDKKRLSKTFSQAMYFSMK